MNTMLVLSAPLPTHSECVLEMSASMALVDFEFHAQSQTPSGFAPYYRLVAQATVGTGLLTSVVIVPPRL